MKKWLFLFALLCSFIGIISGQEDPTGKITKTKGGRVDFHINSIRRIREGVTYTDYLELTILYCDTDHISAGWELYVSSLEPEFQAGMNSVPTIPLNKILISSRMGDGTDIAINQPFSVAGLLIGTGLPPINPENCVQDKVIISISCSSLMGYLTDRYISEMQFELKSK